MTIFREKLGYVYFLMNPKNTVIYTDTGVTNNLQKRSYEHAQKIVEGFTKKYNLNKVVYYEVFDRVSDAIAREKQLKAGSRKKKMELIKKMNPNFEDLMLKFKIASTALENVSQ